MRLLLIDGNSILNRAYYGIKVLTTHDGVPTNALVGFLNIYHRLLEQTGADTVAVAFDRKAPTFRHTMYEGYKAGRKGMPPELAQQLPLMKELLTLMGVSVVEQDGFEADDILGTLSAAATAKQIPCFIATGDRDSLQLVSDSVTVLLAATRMGRPETVVFDPAAIGEKYGLTPSQLIDLKALMGDSSDNIPGVPGVGEKTALDLLHRFGSLDGVYQNIDSADLRESLKTKLVEGKESAYLSYKLGTICRDMPLNTDLSAYALAAPQTAPLSALMTRLELFKLMEKMNLSATVAVAEETPVKAAPTVCENCDLLRSKTVDLLLEDSTVTAIANGAAVTLPATHEAVLACLTNGDIQKRVNDTKALQKLCRNQGGTLAGVVLDTTLAAYLLDPLSSDYSLSRTAVLYGVAIPEGELSESARAFTPVCDRLEKELAAHNQETLLREVEIPLAVVLADMEQEGFAVDGAGIARFGEQLEEKINQLVEGITEAVGYSFNLNSPKQLAKALFEDLGLPAKKKTKSGYSTNAEVLESLKDAHPAVAMLLEYRTLAKLKSTYCDGLLKVLGEDGRIHSSFNQTETRTGRISSAEPNLQNIPVKQPLGRELRRFFGAKAGYLLCDADYSQIELRVLAALSGDATMTAAFNAEEDIHRITASQVFDVPEELVTPLMRSQAKAVNFGIVYGIGAHSLSEDIHVSYGEAKRYIESYLNHYGAVAGYMDGLIAAAKDRGYAETLFSRRRPLPELSASNGMMRSFGERVARNMPIQGTAADIIKIAMIRVHRRLQEEGLDAKLILQVHDELIVEAKADQAPRAAKLLQEEMENAVSLSVKLRADVNVGATWYDAKL